MRSHLYSASVLKRFGAALPGARFVEDAKDLTGEQRMALSAADPDLLAVLDGSCSASVLHDIVTGTWADTVPSAAERQQQANANRVAEILAQHPGGRDGYYDADGRYVDPVAPNMSLMLELAQLDERAYQQQELVRNPPKADPHAMSAEQRQFVQQQLAQQSAARLESLQAAAYYGED